MKILLTVLYFSIYSAFLQRNHSIEKRFNYLEEEKQVFKALKRNLRGGRRLDNKSEGNDQKNWQKKYKSGSRNERTVSVKDPDFSEDNLKDETSRQNEVKLRSKSWVSREVETRTESRDDDQEVLYDQVKGTQGKTEENNQNTQESIENRSDDQ